MATPRQVTPRNIIPSTPSVSQSPAPSWTDDLPVCPLSGIGISTNQIYRQDGGREEEHDMEDQFFHFKCENECYLYGVFDGHDGMHVSDFARLRLPAELLLGQLHEVNDDNTVRGILRQAFITVERGYFQTIDEFIAERTSLKIELPEGLNDYELYQQYRDKIDELQALDNRISGGSSVCISLINAGKLYVANVGDSRTILCAKDANGSLEVKQLSIDHTINNDDELLRLKQLGLHGAHIQGSHFGVCDTTRQIGDHFLKGGYKEDFVLSLAKSEPVIAEPEVIGGLPLNGICGFLAMFTHGVQKSLVDATDTKNPNDDIAAMIAAEFSVQSTLIGVAQGVIDKVVRIHHDTYLCKGRRAAACQKREDMTLLVRNFGHPLGTSVSSPTMPYNPVTVPYNPGHNNGQQLSLIIPPRPPFDSPFSAPVFSPETVTETGDMRPLHVVIHDTMSPSSSHTSTIGSRTSSGVSTPLNVPSDLMEPTTHSTPLHDSHHDSNDSNDSNGPHSGEELLLFQRLEKPSPRSARPDEDGYIVPYVDFAQFNLAYAAALSDHQLSQ